jgi:hypothetical protein
MFWPIYIYLILSITIAGLATFNVGWSTGLHAIATSLLFIVAGGGLKASLWWGDKAQKIGGALLRLFWRLARSGYQTVFPCSFSGSLSVAGCGAGLASPLALYSPPKNWRVNQFP